MVRGFCGSSELLVLLLLLVLVDADLIYFPHRGIGENVLIDYRTPPPPYSLIDSSLIHECHRRNSLALSTTNPDV
jgi:hypothetical protein